MLKLYFMGYKFLFLRHLILNSSDANHFDKCEEKNEFINNFWKYKFLRNVFFTIERIYGDGLEEFKMTILHFDFTVQDIFI